MMRTKRSMQYATFIGLIVLACSTIARGDTRENSQSDSFIPAAQGVVQRLIPAHSKDFEMALIPQDNGQDVFEIESKEGKTILRGNNGVSLCSALNWYLKYFCNADISWNGIQRDLPDLLPVVPQKIRQVSPHRYRYFFNYCCFGYSLPWWDWDQWEFMIDWMAMNGVNMPLAVTGQEATWQKVMRQLDLSEDSIQKFLAGPPYLPFSWMGCLDGWGGPLSQEWIDRHAELQKKILKRERELGMTPVVQGFTGHVPAAIQEKFPDVKLQKIQWAAWNTLFIDPNDPLFQKVGHLFLQQQTQDYGTDHLYATDTFIEMSPPSNDPAFLNDMGKTICSTLTSFDPKAIWVMQGWIFLNNAKFWQPPQSKAFLGGVPDDRMVIIDLHCDAASVWNRTESFYGKPWLWCVILNFGNTVTLSGPLPKINQDLFQAMNDPKRGKLSGIGMIQEGLEYNPVAFEFMTEMTWRTQSVDLDRWIDQYSERRYGKPSDTTRKAWALLLKSVYDSTHGTNWLVTMRPRYDVNLLKDREEQSLDLVAAWEQLILSADTARQSDAYQFDLVNVTRQILSNYAFQIYAQAMAAYQKSDIDQFRSATRDFFQLLRDMDEILGTRSEFLLGKWIADAKRWGKTESDRNVFEWNARTGITLWGDAESEIHDYARKEWSGLITSFYLNRWKMYFDGLEKSLLEKKPFDNDAYTREVKTWEVEWAHQQDAYPDKPSGDSVDTAIKLFAKYQSAVKN